MKIFYSVLLFIVIISVMAIGYIFLTEEPVVSNDEPKPDDELLEMDLRVEFVPEEGIESQEIRVLNENNEIMFQLSIDELNQWTEDNWDIFEEAPEVGGRLVDSDGFGFFDREASISPDNKRLVFSVSDYAVATTVSFVIVVDIDTGEMEMVNKPTRGSVEEYAWSDNGELIAYTLGTARAGGDFLRVDNVLEMKNSFTLSEEELLGVLDPDQELVEVGQFMPVFSNPEWLDDRLYFSTEHPDSNDQVNWSVASDGLDLRTEEQIMYEGYESSRLGVDLEYPVSAEVNYENDQLKVTYVGPDSQMTEITDGFTFFVDLQDLDNRSLEQVAEQEFEERTEMLESITPPYMTEVEGREVANFVIEGGLGGEHFFSVYEDDDRAVITSYFIADPNDQGYDQMVENIFFSIETN